MKQLNHYDAILLMAGSSTRYKKNKCLEYIYNKRAYLYSYEVFNQDPKCDKIIVVTNDADMVSCEIDPTKTIIVTGGLTRNDSVKNGLKEVNNSLFLIHDAARVLLKQEDIDLLLSSVNKIAGYLYNEEVNTIRYADGEDIKLLDRTKVHEVITPQLFKIEVKDLILNNTDNVTDEISIVEKHFPIDAIKTFNKSIKLTYPEDLDIVKGILAKESYKVGFSYDFHPFTDGDSITLGGVKIPFDKAVAAHSDGDVLLHAIVESGFGALNSGDLGKHYPSSDNKYYKISSTVFLEDLKQELSKAGYTIVNIDSQIYLEKPKLASFIGSMKQNIAKILEISPTLVSIKSTTMERRGLVGMGEGIAVEAVMLIKKQD